MRKILFDLFLGVAIDINSPPPQNNFAASPGRTSACCSTYPQRAQKRSQTSPPTDPSGPPVSVDVSWGGFVEHPRITKSGESNIWIK